MFTLSQQLKTKSKTISEHKTLDEAVRAACDKMLYFVGLSYIGQFPIFKEAKSLKTYKIIGSYNGIICSPSASDLKSAGLENAPTI